jgi:hypothetical protein
MNTKLPVLALFALATLAPLEAGAADRGTTNKPWIHIEVQEDGEDSASVKINLPLSLARVALDMAPDSVLSEGKIEVHGTDFTVEDMRKIWKEVREAGDAEFVTVQEEDATVKISRKQNKIFIHVDDKSEKESVRVEIPVALVDALLRGTGNTLNVDEAVAELEKMGKGDIVRVDSDHENVRIWIE